MKKVVCINDTGMEYVVFGEQYEVLQETSDSFLISVDQDHAGWYTKDRFGTVAKEDIINKPEHYHKGGIDVLELIERKAPEKLEGFLMGNLWKYAIRYSEKGQPKEDLEKAEFYLKKLIDLYDEKKGGKEKENA